MRIVGFQSENFKKLRVVDITPDANAVLLTGGNEQGKTSLLDGIESVLEGEKVLKRTPKPIRDGEERAFNIVALGEPSYDEHGNEVECRPTLKATRTFTAKGSYLKVENIEGAQYKSPQAILDKLVGDLTFDPLAFSNLKDKEQLETLLKLVQIPLDLDEWAAERKAVYEGRTALNRVVSDLEGQVKAFVVEPDTPDEEISAASVLAEMR
ncbi:MAG: AAA family ATPase, partial [Patescibacteria group bacterium]